MPLIHKENNLITSKVFGWPFLDKPLSFNLYMATLFEFSIKSKRIEIENSIFGLFSTNQKIGIQLAII